NRVFLPRPHCLYLFGRLCMSTSTIETSLPRWDMTPIFPSLESPEFAKAFEDAVTDIQALGTLFEKHAVRRRETASVDAAFVAAYEQVTDALNLLYDKIRTLGSYIGCFTSTDAKNETAQMRESLLNVQSEALDQLGTRYVAW